MSLPKSFEQFKDNVMCKLCNALCNVYGKIAILGQYYMQEVNQFSQNNQHKYGAKTLNTMFRVLLNLFIAHFQSKIVPVLQTRGQTLKAINSIRKFSPQRCLLITRKKIFPSQKFCREQIFFKKSQPCGFFLGKDARLNWLREGTH